jgi:hypothetical protein
MQRVNLFPTWMPPPHARFECATVWRPVPTRYRFRDLPGRARRISALDRTVIKRPLRILPVSCDLFTAFFGLAALGRNMFGSNDGSDAIASISPLLGSIE